MDLIYKLKGELEWLICKHFWMVFGEEAWSFAQPLTSAVAGFYTNDSQIHSPLLYVLLYLRLKWLWQNMQSEAYFYWLVKKSIF